MPLTPKPFAVLRYLVDNAGRLITHEELLNAVWPDTYVQPEVLRRYILEIRRVLGDRADNSRFVETFPKRGYQFVAPVTSETADKLSGDFQTTTKLVGRDVALTQLDNFLKRAIQGNRQVVFVSGEAGIGKTSLVDAFHRRAANIPDLLVIRGQSVEGFGGKEAYYPIFEALGQLIRGSAATILIDRLAAHAPTWILQFPALLSESQQKELRHEVLGVTREHMVRELCEALEVITETCPLVVILEDLHWADHSTVDIISAIARRREPAKLLVLGTFRPADLILSESPLKTLKQDLLLHRLGSELPLERLSESNVADYLASELVNADLPPGFASVIHRHSDGNPLFMTAILDHLKEQAVLRQTDGRWEMITSLEEIDPGVPETLRQMLELQLQHTSNAEQRLLKCASVAGLHFNAWSVATMMAGDSSDVEEQCAALANRQQFLKASGVRELSNGRPTTEYEFRHSLYRDVLYRHLNPTERMNFHKLLAEGLESLRSTAEGEAAAEIALHFEHGREFERAIKYLIFAAKNATRRYAHRESIEALEHARQLLLKIAPESSAEMEVQILEKIGDSQYAMGDMEQSAATYHAMATRASAAGLLTAQANALMRLAHSAEAIPFFQKAIELDPTLAVAHVSLSRIYSNLGDAERAKQYAQSAYDRREQVSERERLSIIYQYHYEVTGDQERASQTLEAWKQSFPKEFQPANSLAYIHNVLGQFERAIEEAKEALRRNPSHGFPYSNLAHAYRGLGQFDEARKTAERAVEYNIETLPTRRLLYELAVLAGDNEAALKHVEWGRDKPREFEFFGAQAQAAACSGKLRDARDFYEETIRMAELRNLADVGTNHLALATWIEVAFGNTAQALQGARRVLSRNPNYDPRLRAAFSLSLTGFADEAESIVNELVRANPQHTIINCVLGPIVRSAIALVRKEPRRAIDELSIVSPYEFGFCAALAPSYLRGQSHLLLGSGIEAAEEFQRLLDHRGSEPFSPFFAVATLNLARALAMQGNITESRTAYERFFDSWRDADQEIPILAKGREEVKRLGGDPS